MISNKILPAHLLVLYTWELLEANVGLQKINDLIPIVPLGEEPKLVDSKMPYLVYGYVEQASTRTKEIDRGALSLRIVARTFGQLGSITATIKRAFKDGDDSAENVNLWSSLYDAADLDGIRFTNLEVTYVEGGDAPKTESGPVEGLINIGYQYISRQTIKTFRPAGTRLVTYDIDGNPTYSTTISDEWV